MNEEYEKRLIRQEVKNEQFEKVLSELTETVREIKSVLTTLAAIQVEITNNNNQVNEALEQTKVLHKRVSDVNEKAEKGEQAYWWVTKGAMYVLSLVALAVFGVMFSI